MSTSNPQEISNMNLGPKMELIVRVYQMTEAENAVDLERDRAMFKSGAISKRDFRNRSCTRDVARYYGPAMMQQDHHGRASGVAGKGCNATFSTCSPR